MLHGDPEWWVKIADFGVSKRTESTALRTHVGTLPYMAPEVLGFKIDQESTTEDTFSLAVDIWSVGVITFQTVTAQLAFPTINHISDFVKNLSDIPISDLITPEVTDFIKATLTISPRRRPTSENALAHSWFTINKPNPSLQTPHILRYAALDSYVYITK